MPKNTLPDSNSTSIQTPFLRFDRPSWSKLRAMTPLLLTKRELSKLSGVGEEVSLQELAEIYLPLSRLLNLHITASQNLSRVTDRFLGHPSATAVPYVIGIAGSVAVGKSTTARIMRELLSRWPEHPRVDLVTTDGFLHPNKVLEERGLMSRKGFPESYDRKRLVKFVADVKSGLPQIEAPIYSHITYDIIPDQVQTIEAPDIVIIEGLNVLQSTADYRTNRPRVFVSDYFDFSIYVDAHPDLLKHWYIERFLKLRNTAFRDQSSYFKRYANLTSTESIAMASRIWVEINAPNLEANIAPTRNRARLVLEKGENHAVQQVWLRKM